LGRPGAAAGRLVTSRSGARVQALIGDGGALIRLRHQMQ